MALYSADLLSNGNFGRPFGLLLSLSRLSSSILRNLTRSLQFWIRSTFFCFLEALVSLVVVRSDASSSFLALVLVFVFETTLRIDFSIFFLPFVFSYDLYLFIFAFLLRSYPFVFSGWVVFCYFCLHLSFSTPHIS